MFDRKTLLVTGGTGSFGQAVMQRFLDSDVGEIRVFSRDEKKQEDMRISLSNPKIKYYIGDVRDIQSLKPAMNGVDFVFHAAALKQVPSCEFYPLEALKTNAIATENVLDSAIQNGVSKVIALSTDKAVYPINAMGISKAMMEKILVARSRHIAPELTTLCCTRYGNVMASRGSVIPLFIKQIMAGQPLTVTDPAMTRFLMSIDDAVDLVLHAFQNGVQGDTFVQKAPASTIGNLAQALLELFDARNEIQIIGTRHGEKRHETLLTREEMNRAELHGRYFRVPADGRNLNYNKYVVEGQQSHSESDDYHSANTRQLDVAEIKETLQSLEFVAQQIKLHRSN